MRRVAIEEDLTNVKEYLERRGYQVFGIEEGGVGDVEAVVIRGTDQNMTGMQNIFTKAPIVSAEGRTPEEIYEEIENKILRTR